MFTYLLLCILLLINSSSQMLAHSAALVMIKSKEDCKSFFGVETGSILFRRAKLPFDHKETKHLDIKHFPPIQKFFEGFVNSGIMDTFDELIFADKKLRPFCSIRRIGNNSPLELNVNLSEIKLRFNERYAQNYKVIQISFKTKENK